MHGRRSSDELSPGFRPADTEQPPLSLRYFNAFGPYQASGPVRKIIPSFAQWAMRGLPIEIFGSGEQVVDSGSASK
jgi:nucleoside-diphosphate-sugar epimerase